MSELKQSKALTTRGAWLRSYAYFCRQNGLRACKFSSLQKFKRFIKQSKTV